MTTKFHSKNTEAGFVPIRRGLFDHIQLGLMKGRDLSTYIAIHFFADYDTGVAYNVSAPYLANFLHERPDRIRRSLRRLEGGGYIKRFAQKGGEPGYDIVIDKYLVKKCISIDAAKSKSINEIAFTVKENCTLTVNREYIECTSGEHRALPIKDIKILTVKEINKSEDKKPRTNPAFIPPTPEQVEEYAGSIGFEVDGAEFVDFYESKGWMVGKNKMKDWKAAVRTWKIRKDKNGSNKIIRGIEGQPGTPHIR